MLWQKRFSFFFESTVCDGTLSLVDRVFRVNYVLTGNTGKDKWKPMFTYYRFSINQILLVVWCSNNGKNIVPCSVSKRGTVKKNHLSHHFWRKTQQTRKNMYLVHYFQKFTSFIIWSLKYLGLLGAKATTRVACIKKNNTNRFILKERDTKQYWNLCTRKNGPKKRFLVSLENL